MIENMTTFFELKPPHPLGVPCDQAGVDSHRRAECEERIKHLLSALEGGTSVRQGNTENEPKEVIPEAEPSPDSETGLRFLLTDRIGPIAEFASWEDARKYMCDLQISGASILRVEKKPLDSGATTDQQNDSALDKRPALRRRWAAASEALLRLLESRQ